MKLVGIIVGMYLGSQLGALVGVGIGVGAVATGALDEDDAGPATVGGFGLGVVGGALVGGYIGYRVAS